MLIQAGVSLSKLIAVKILQGHFWNERPKLLLNISNEIFFDFLAKLNQGTLQVCKSNFQLYILYGIGARRIAYAPVACKGLRPTLI